MDLVEGERYDAADDEKAHREYVGGEAGQHVLVRQDIENSFSFNLHHFLLWLLLNRLLHFDSCVQMGAAAKCQQSKNWNVNFDRGVQRDFRNRKTSDANVIRHRVSARHGDVNGLRN